MRKLLKPEELDARIESGKVLVESYKRTQDMGFLKKAISMLLFREHGLENYQPLYISAGARKILGEEAFNSLVEHLKTPRSRIFPAVAGKIRKLGYDYSDFVVEHVVDVSSMVNYVLASDVEAVRDRVIKLGRTCPICIVSKREDDLLVRHGRNNVEDPWEEYDRVGIKREKIRSFCGPLNGPGAGSFNESR